MKNVTISLPEEVAQWARVEAAKAGKSLSRWLADKLTEERAAGNDQAAAIETFLSRPKKPLLGPGEQLPGRDEIYAERLLRHEPHGVRPSERSAREGGARRGLAEDGEPFKSGGD